MVIEMRTYSALGYAALSLGMGMLSLHPTAQYVHDLAGAAIIREYSRSRATMVESKVEPAPVIFAVGLC